MTDKEILFALSNMLDPIKGDISEMKGDISGLKEDVSGLKEDVSGLKADVSEMKKEMSEMNTRLKKVELTQENVILPRLQNIEACYTSTYDRYKQSVEDYETLKMDMDVVKRIVAEHSAKLQMIPI